MNPILILFLVFLQLVNGENETPKPSEPLPEKAFQAVCSMCCSQSCTDNSDYGSCSTNKKGKVRYDEVDESFKVCDGRSWKVIKIKDNLREGLVGYWPMDEEMGKSLADFSGNENHATATTTSITLAKIGRGRHFNSNGVITVANSATINFGSSSFTVAGWIKILDTTYPLTTFSVRKGFGCYLGPSGSLWVPGWEIAHGYGSSGTSVCIRDHRNYKVLVSLKHDSDSLPSKLTGKWAHYAFVYDRENNKIFGYINGKQQQHVVDISTVTGSVDNNKNLEFGQQYGWKTKGTLDEYRLYNRALEAEEIQRLYLF